MIYFLIFIMTILGAFGAYFLKKAILNSVNRHILLTFYLYLGASLYILGALINISILRFLPYNIVLPLTSITYIWTLMIANRFLKEKITRNKLMGIIIIIIGISLIVIK